MVNCEMVVLFGISHSRVLMRRRKHKNNQHLLQTYNVLNLFNYLSSRRQMVNNFGRFMASRDAFN